MLPKDARIYQIVFLLMFLVVGIGTRDWTLQPGMIAVTIATCLLTQWGMEVLRWQLTEDSQSEPQTLLEATAQPAEIPPSSPLSSRPSHPHASTSPRPPFYSSLLSALITSLGLSLLLRADSYSTLMLASGIAIVSKFLLRVRGKHIFNPANFGIIAALLLTPDAWVSPGQWGEEGWYALLFLGTGGIVLKQVGRWDTTIAFLATYAGLEAIRNLWLGWTWDVWAHRLMSGSLLLFALFMITDPRTIPDARIGRLIWAVTIALLTFFLRNFLFVPTAVFWALFTLAPLSILLDWLFPGDRFRWTQEVVTANPDAAVYQETGMTSQ
ncbi:MAG: RnfABCDGE type electron transport complex subunit D [Scytolyngbya sp. HA4215-MV1]|nr:RnfABCDGE type electron transport complex subunit D [Scytolyngbya sp. HA4215-MV1]